MKTPSYRRWCRLIRGSAGRDLLSNPALQSQLVNVYEIPGRLRVTHDPLDIAIDDVLFGCIVPPLRSRAKRGIDTTDPDQRDLWYFRIRDPILAYLSEFWMCLGLLSISMPLFPNTPAAVREEPQIYHQVVLAIANWWPELVRLEGRLYGAVYKTPGRWLDWGSQICRYCYLMGVSPRDVMQTHSLDVAEAGTRFQKWAGA
jgi:hypothetical protein